MRWCNDGWVNDGWEWGTPISHEEFIDAQKGKFKMVLTPKKDITKNWFPDPIKGKQIL